MTASNPIPPFDPPTPSALRWMALGVAALTFVLVIVGALVTSFRVGLAVPDWPTTFHENMFLYDMFHSITASFGVRLEHAHRLLGAAVGLLTIVLAVWLQAREPRGWVRRLGWIALAAVIFQGVLGGLRVRRLSTEYAAFHGTMAQSFFAFMACLALFTSSSWSAAGPAQEAGDAGRLRRLAIFTSVLIYLQLVSGSVLRHLGLGLHLHMALAALVLLHIGLLIQRVFLHHADQAAMVRTSSALLLLAGLQLMLGMASWSTADGYGVRMLHPPTLEHIWITTAHVAVGALTFVAALVLTLQAHRFLRPAGASGPSILAGNECVA